MAYIKVHYKAVDPYYEDQTQTFIAETLAKCEDQMMDFEDYLGRNHGGTIWSIYKSEIIEEVE